MNTSVNHTRLTWAKKKKKKIISLFYGWEGSLSHRLIKVET